jgi:hypothetical protein
MGSPGRLPSVNPRETDTLDCLRACESGPDKVPPSGFYWGIT